MADEDVVVPENEKDLPEEVQEMPEVVEEAAPEPKAEEKAEETPAEPKTEEEKKPEDELKPEEVSPQAVLRLKRENEEKAKRIAELESGAAPAVLHSDDQVVEELRRVLPGLTLKPMDTSKAARDARINEVGADQYFEELEAHKTEQAALDRLTDALLAEAKKEDPKDRKVAVERFRDLIKEFGWNNNPVKDMETMRMHYDKRFPKATAPAPSKIKKAALVGSSGTGAAETPKMTPEDEQAIFDRGDAGVAEWEKRQPEVGSVVDL